MLTIRLTRKGRKNQPFFRVVVIDRRRSAKGGRAVEVLGHVDPLTKKKALKKDRILHWIKMGAQPSGTVHNLLISEKIIEGKKIHVARVKKPTEAQTTAAAPVVVPAGGETPALASASASMEATAGKPAPETKPVEILKEEPKKEETPKT